MALGRRAVARMERLKGSAMKTPYGKALDELEKAGERIAELEAALKSCRNRFHACILHGGAPQWQADASCERYDRLLS